MARVFIGMAVYNGEKTIKETIDSLLNQTYTDFILFISDDASTDKTPKIAKEYSVKDRRVRYHRQEKNTGMFPNMKFVVDKADTDYFMWSDCDDLYEIDFIRTCIELLEKNSAYSIAMTGACNIDIQGRVIRYMPDVPYLSGKPTVLSVSRFLAQPETLGKCILMYSIFKTDAIKTLYKIYQQRSEWGTDYIFSLAMVSHYGVIIESKLLFKKRMGGASDSERETRAPGEMIIIKNPKNRMFPVGGGRFKRFLNSNLEAVEGTPYKFLVLFILCIRSIRAWFLFLKNRNYKKRFNKITSIFIRSRKK